MNTTDATPAADRGSECNALLGLAQERAAFEAWCVQRWRGDRNALGRNGEDHPKNPGEYTIGNVEFAWQAWQRARVDVVAALQWYADGLHFDKASPDAWDTVSGEPQNWWCDEAGTATVKIELDQVRGYAAALNARCVADAADAERYRWLRDKAPGEIHFDHTEDNYYFELNVPFDGEPINDNEESARRLDASIDAQIVADRIGAA